MRRLTKPVDQERSIWSLWRNEGCLRHFGRLLLDEIVAKEKKRRRFDFDVEVDLE